MTEKHKHTALEVFQYSFVPFLWHLVDPYIRPLVRRDICTKAYEKSERITWKPSSCPETSVRVPLEEGDTKEVQWHILEIVRYATLAPSYNNSQCWRFRVGKDDMSVTILPDFSRRCPVVDSDNHHLYMSLGCVVENLVIAAKAHGLESDVDSSKPDSGIHVKFSPRPREVSLLFDAIPKRQTARVVYDGLPLSRDELEHLERAGTGNGVRVILLTGPTSREMVLHYVLRGTAIQHADKLYNEELDSWTRFNQCEAVKRGDGLSLPTKSRSTPSWLHRLPFFVRVFGNKVSPTTDKTERQIRSSAGFAVFVSEEDGPAHWVEAGRCYERFSLQATALGIRNAILGEIVNVPEVRGQFAHAVGLNDGRPDLVVRFGRGGPATPHSLRRPVHDVVEE